jgi:lanosterol synthase
MTEYSYPECTTASVMGLVTFSKKYPNYRKEEIEYVGSSEPTHDPPYSQDDDVDW